MEPDNLYKTTILLPLAYSVIGAGIAFTVSMLAEGRSKSEPERPYSRRPTKINLDQLKIRSREFSNRKIHFSK